LANTGLEIFFEIIGRVGASYFLFHGPLEIAEIFVLVANMAEFIATPMMILSMSKKISRLKLSRKLKNLQGNYEKYAFKSLDSLRKTDQEESSGSLSIMERHSDSLGSLASVNSERISKI
jgi:hypothetical protein